MTLLQTELLDNVHCFFDTQLHIHMSYYNTHKPKIEDFASSLVADLMATEEDFAVAG